MVTEADNEELAARLRNAYAKKTKKSNNIRLPTSIKFAIDEDLTRIHLSPSCVKANMQDNAASFEGWALAIKSWLPEIKQVELSWSLDGEDNATHYQRFLFRAKEFKSIFQPWFSISSLNDNEFGKLRTETAEDHVVNVPTKIRETAAKDRCFCISEALNNEHKLECFIKDDRSLEKHFGIDQLDRQFPVGVFAGKDVSAENEIFPGHHGAIDLWGINKKAKRLFLFELKIAGNNRIGILSEMFFYSFVMEAIRQKRFKIAEPYQQELTSATLICTYILAPEWHPLIDEDLIRMTNRAFAEGNRQISFGIVWIKPEGMTGFYDEIIKAAKTEQE